MAGYWARRAEKSRRAKAVQRETDLEVKKVADALKANKKASKEYLDDLRKSGDEKKYKEQKAYLDKLWKENETWVKLKIKSIKAEGKHEKQRQVGAVDDRISIFAAWRLKRAILATNRASKMVADYLSELGQKTLPIERKKQIETGDLSYIPGNNFYGTTAMRQTTVKDVGRRLQESELPAQKVASVETVREDRNVERGGMYERVSLQDELARHGRAREEREEESLSAEENHSVSERSSERSELSHNDLSLE